ALKFKSGNRSLGYKLLLLQERLSARYADRVLTVSHPLKDHILVGHGLAPERIHVIANFPDDDVFRLRPTYEMNGQVRLIFHGTILERYGLRDLLLGLSKVRNRNRVFLRIIGEGDFAPELTEIISSLRLQDIVRFENRVYPMHEIPDQIADCNLGIVPL